MKRTNKFTYYVVLQQNYGQSFEDIEFFQTDSTYFLNKENRKELRNCIENYTFKSSYPVRTIRRKVLNTI